jgi:hypothetical protein
MNPAAVQLEEAPRIVFFDTNFFRALLKGNFHQNMADLESDLREAILSAASMSLLKHPLYYFSEKNRYDH